MLTVVFAVISEERSPEPPYGSGKLINREIVAVHRHHASAQAALEAEREHQARFLSSRFHSYIQSERVEEELAREVPA